MSSKMVSSGVLQAIVKSRFGVSDLAFLESLKLTDSLSLKTTLSRLNKAGKILRLKRGVYSSNPLVDEFYCAQSVYNGYLGFSTALYLHKLITEVPFTIFVVTTSQSKSKNFGEYEFKAVSLKEKAIGFTRLGGYVVSTRPKTLFDCLYLPQYGVGEKKLIDCFKQAELSKKEWSEFDFFARKFCGKALSEKMLAVKARIRGG
ncbi:hypothetical protein HY993_04210 [Candidatus Micrarchaeota archaeon]|nr:hypothetical protein [Candidatus Micrarchaeota archaeon]